MLDFFITHVSDPLLLGVCIFLMGSFIYLTVKTNFVQIRFIPFLFSQLKKSFTSKNVDTHHTVSPHKALFTAMSTTIGISTIVGPVIAIQLGGPGALIGFLLTSFFGSAATYLEVHLSVLHRKTLPSGEVMGGPMQYLSKIFSPAMGKWYAICCMCVMVVWSAAQANQLAAILSSPSLGAYKISPLYSAIGVSVLAFFALTGGIRRIGSFSSKLVPVMFVLYIGSSLWIIGSNLDQMGRVFHEIFGSFSSPHALASGSLVGGVVSALRWGIFKGVQATEAGVGTQAIPHSMAETQDAHAQGALAMLSSFSAGGIAFLSGCVALLTQTWQDPSLPLGISMVAASYQQYFSFAGVAIVAISAILFGFGTIVGNSFNGGQCYSYLTKNGNKKIFLFAMIGMIFLGSLGEAKTVWSLIDVVLSFMVIPHMLGLLLSVRKTPELFRSPS